MVIVAPAVGRPRRVKIFAMRKPVLVLLLLALPGLLSAAKNLVIYSIDVEGGQATLFVSPSGETMLVDTGWPGFNKRDADRIAAAAKHAGVKKIDYLVTTHFHTDHVGGVPQLADKLPIHNFVDHGASIETTQPAKVLFNAYSAYRDKGQHILVKPGDTVPIKGIDVKVLSAAGKVLDAPLAGAGKPNPECAGFAAQEEDTTENAQSVGMLVTFGKFRMLDLGDLTSNKEKDLVCPANKIGDVDFFLVSHHGTDSSNAPAFVHALHPKAALMNNGPRKGGTAVVWQTVHDTPGLQDLWQLHFAVAGGKDHNSPDNVIANLDETNTCSGQWIRIEAQKEGPFKLYNSRNKYEKEYR
jgi:beta-lactamase superfamily II metal-dependent hydrolase